MVFIIVNHTLKDVKV